MSWCESKPLKTITIANGMTVALRVKHNNQNLFWLRIKNTSRNVHTKKFLVRMKDMYIIIRIPMAILRRIQNCTCFTNFNNFCIWSIKKHHWHPFRFEHWRVLREVFLESLNFSRRKVRCKKSSSAVSINLIKFEGVAILRALRHVPH